MEIEKIVELKEELEVRLAQQIVSMIEQFEKDTGCYVEDLTPSLVFVEDMTKNRNFTSPIVRATTSFHTDNARRQIGKEPANVTPT